MRSFIGIVLLIGTSLLLDEVSFNGRYREAAWLSAKQEGSRLNQKISNWLKRLGP